MISSTGQPIRKTDSGLHGEVQIKGITGEEIKNEVMTWRNRLWQNRILKRNLWDECWALYAGTDDWSDKEDWQSKIIVPKAWASVKQATNVMKRLLGAAKEPWRLEPDNPEDMLEQLRAEQTTDITKYFLDQANFLRAFAEGLECGFIIGLGVWKLWWGLQPRMHTSVGQDGNGQKQLTRKEILEGKLFIRAVDPYNFFWLPGSLFPNKWVGTIEQVEVAKWELMEMADRGVFDKDLVKLLPMARLNPQQEQSQLRFNELPFRASFTGNPDIGMVRLTEYYGPLTKNGELIERNAHVIIAGDSMVLLAQKNQLLHRTPPYIGFSPLILPFRTEGIGLIERVRAIDKAINKIANMSVDTLVLRLMPVFEVPPDVYENPEDFETGLHPGKIFRRNIAHAGVEGLRPIQFEDVSAGALQVAGQLDRAHQEGALVSEIQQALPRFRGAQTATEVETKQANQDTFFGNMAADIEQQVIEPLVMLAWETIFQFIDSAGDERIASILGVHKDILAGMSKAEMQEAILGQYKVKATGITEQLEKAEVLQQLVQFMNIVGQNPEAWTPYINQDKLLQKILESFRPAIHNLEDIIASPEITAAKQQASQQQAVLPDLIRLIPQLSDQAHSAAQAQAQQQADAQKEQNAQANAQQQAQMQAQAQQQQFALQQAQINLQNAKAQAFESGAARPSAR